MKNRANIETRRSISWLIALVAGVALAVVLVRQGIAGPGLAVPAGIAMFFTVAFWLIRLFAMPAERAAIEDMKKEHTA